jgi:hypothetical protein
VKNAHQIGDCWCGFYHDPSTAMIEYARDLTRDNPKMTTEELSHALFEDFHDLARAADVSEEVLRQMALGTRHPNDGV